MSNNIIIEKTKNIVRSGFAFLKFIPDEPYLKFYYRLRTGKKLNLDNPKGFNEKLNWIKIYDRNPIYTQMADKLLARNLVKERIGDGYSIPLLGHWNSFDEIDFETLPDSFVLKCNHDSGSITVIKDKNTLTAKDKKRIKKHFDRRLKVNPWWMAREWPYKNIRPCIIAEQHMEGEFKDYKFYCFNGEPKIVYLASGIHTDNYHEDHFDMDGNFWDIRKGSTPSKETPKLPDTFPEMKEIVKRLAEGTTYVRLDLYEINGKVYFGEYTFFNAGGTQLFDDDRWEIEIGNYIDISAVRGI